MAYFLHYFIVLLFSLKVVHGLLGAQARERNREGKQLPDFPLPHVGSSILETCTRTCALCLVGRPVVQRSRASSVFGTLSEFTSPEVCVGPVRGKCRWRIATVEVPVLLAEKSCYLI